MWTPATRPAATGTENGNRRHNACARGNMRRVCIRMPRSNVPRQRLPLQHDNTAGLHEMLPPAHDKTAGAHAMIKRENVRKTMNNRRRFQSDIVCIFGTASCLEFPPRTIPVEGRQLRRNRHLERKRAPNG